MTDLIIRANQKRVLSDATDAITKAKEHFRGTDEADVDYHLSEALNHLNIATEYFIGEREE